MSPWNDERIAQLQDLWASGLSASQIADRLGEVSRSAVLGKIRRLRLPSRPTLSRRNASQRSNQKTQPRIPTRVRTRPQRSPAWRYPVTPIDDADETERADLVPLLDLGRECCRWPIGDPKQPGFGFCGRKQLNGLSYCARHARRAFRFDKRQE